MVKKAAEAIKMILESWFEEFTHDWLKESEGAAHDGWVPNGCVTWNALTSGKMKVPPGTLIRFMSGVHDPDGGPALVPTGFPIVHHFAFTPDLTGRRREYSFPSTRVGEREVLEGLGIVRPSDRDANQPQGCAISIKMDPNIGRGVLEYWASSDEANSSPVVSVNIARK